MKRTLVYAVILLTLSSAPAALASDSFSSSALVLSGDLQLDTDAAAVYVPAGSRALSFEAVASSITLHRKYVNATQAGGIEIAGDQPGQVAVESTETFGPSRLGTMQTRALAALLATAQTGPLVLHGKSAGFMDIATVQDPEVRQDAAVAAGLDESATYGVATKLAGEFVNVTPGEGTYELRGDFELQLFDVDYFLTDAKSTRTWQTGVYETASYGPAQRHRYELHTLTLHDALLIVTTAAPASVFSKEPTIAFDGTLRAQDAENTDALTTMRFQNTRAENEWKGSATFAVTADQGRLGIGGDSGASTLGAAVALDRSPLGAAIAAALVGLALLVAVLVVLKRRREEPSLEAALLAMEERRWDIALDHLERLLANGPADPILLVDRAICYENTGRLEEARSSFEAALVEAPGNAEAHYYYARVLARLRMSTACLAHLSRALALDERLNELARKEPAFRAFQDHPQFLRLLGA